MKRNEIPDFVRNGAFDWSRAGFHFSVPTVVVPENPWFQLLPTIEDAKVGRFKTEGQRVLHELASAESDRLNIYPTSLHLIGDIGVTADVPFLAKMLEDGHNYQRAYSAQAASLMNNAALVPEMIVAWGRTSDRMARAMIGSAISDLLEERASLSSESELEKLSISHESAPNFVETAESLYLERLNSTGILWHGQPFNVWVFAETFHRLICKNISIWDSALTVPYRHKFEASTGIDCSTFYRGGRFDRDVAISVLETFLTTVSKSDYMEGRRYFFDHLIP